MRLLNLDTLLLIFLLCFSLILFSLNNNSVVSSIKGELADIIEFIMYPQTWYEGIFSIKEENQILIKKNTILNLLNAELSVNHRENNYLKEMLEYKEEAPFSLIMSKVVAHDFSFSLRNIIIDIGKEDGVYKNMPAMDMNGLIGKTSSIGDVSSSVQLINDNNFRVSIRVGQEMVLGEFVPTFDVFGKLNGIRKTADIKENDIVYTSGDSKIYPKNLPVAKVLTVNRDGSKLFQDISVKILADINNYNYIFLIKE